MLLVWRVQCSTFRHAHQENNEVKDGRPLSFLRGIEVEPLSISRCSARANESALMETGRKVTVIIMVSMQSHEGHNEKSMIMMIMTKRVTMKVIIMIMALL